MSRKAQTPHMALAGMVLMAGVLCGLFRALGLWTPEPGARSLAETLKPLPDEPRWAAPYWSIPCALTLFGAIALGFGTHALPYALSAALLTLLAPALRRPALLVFVVASLLYLPQLGAYALWDPWETHYGEVSREIMARADWISLWQQRDQWFFSKPILIFWAEALSWSALGTEFRADHFPQHAEWVLRLPTYALSIASLLTVHAAVARIWSRRAGILAALVLTTTPYYGFLTRQAVTDMPFVATMTIAMMLLVLALCEDPERLVTPLRLGRVALSLQHAVIGLIVSLSLPQILYLASRNITWHGNKFSWHRDRFLFGSAGNADIPGNPAHHIEHAYVRAFALEPLGQALLWAAGLSVIVWLLRRERRRSVLYMYAFYALCALSFMAKGIPGFALPGLVAALALLAGGRLSVLFEGRLRVAAGTLVLLVIGMPWFVAMYVRLGPAFVERIVIHDHLNRLTSGVHGDNASVQYFIWQLGYGMFPWSGFVPLALGAWLGVSRSSVDPVLRARRDTLLLLGLWFAVSFTLFSAMTTKFHHYILPAVPPAAIFVGLALDRMLPSLAFTRSRATWLRAAGLMLAPALLVLGFAGLRGDVRGVLPAQLSSAERATWVFTHAWPPALCGLLLLAGLALYALPALRERPARATHSFLLAAISSAVLLAFIGRDLSWHVPGDVPGSARLIHLFIYKYSRPWPEQFDYRPVLFGFSATAVLLTLATIVDRLRGRSAVALLGLALCFSAFCLNVYLIDLTPHWSQAKLIQRYYAQRTGEEEPLLAWQLNWKGENFYTGNRVHAFSELNNTALLEWVAQNAGRKVFVLVEPSRLPSFKRLLPKSQITPLSTLRECNKYQLVRTVL
jgi:4-amino-4-deoxy-L-arabinose transferase-like glycosyltransferase